jgi:hypothetical protein
MEISLNELKINAFKHGFSFTESSSPYHKEAVLVEALKEDPHDKVRFTTYTEVAISDYLSSAERVKVYIQCIKDTEAAINARSEQNVSECQHNFITHFGQKVCTKCRGKFAQSLNIELGYN